jgi:integrase
MLSSLLLSQSLSSSSRPARPSSPDLAGILCLLALLGDRRQGRPANPERASIRGMTLRRFCQEKYLPERNHAPRGPTAELTAELLERFQACFGRELLVKELAVGTLRQFHCWLAGKIGGGLSPATANLRLRQLRAIWNHAARWQWLDNGRRWHAVRRPPPMEFFPERDPEVDAWTPAQLAAIEAQARSLAGDVPGTAVPNKIFWTAWTLVFCSLGSRVTATMLTRRGDYDAKARALLLRKEHQKQKQDQRIALPPRAALAVEQLLACHQQENIFGCWPFDPPIRATGRHKWKILTKHFVRLLLDPIGLKLPKGVKTRQFRRTAATMCEENGGNAQELLGHADRKTTDRYKDRKRKPICRQSLFIPQASPQRTLFER